MADDCVFCTLKDVEGVEWCASWKGIDIFRFPPLNPVVEGHMLFVAGKHTASAAEDPMLSGKVFEVASWYMRNRGPANLITSAGHPATQSVFHLHVHYVPRAEGDGLPLPWTPQQRREREHP